MSENLDFSVPEAGRPESSGGNIKVFYVLITVLLILSIVNTYFLFKGGPEQFKKRSSHTPSDQDLKELALKLEKQDLRKQAADTWKEYLSAAEPDTQEISRIWYRIGTLFQEESDYEEALSAYYRSESFARPDDIKNETNRRIQECLESAGKFAALRHELKSRVGRDIGAGNIATPSAGGNESVAAEIGAYKITLSDLDKKIENIIDSRIRSLTRYLSDEQINMEKEKLLKQYSSDNGRRMFLEQFIIEELLYRKAREEQLSDKPDIKESLKDMERSFLASMVLEKSYNDEIKITPMDIKNYYEANKGKYIKKEEDGQERQLEFEEARDRVAFDLISDKEKDVQQRLFSQLREQYNVVIHNSALSGNENSQIE
jgi:hypothetical protein